MVDICVYVERILLFKYLTVNSVGTLDLVVDHGLSTGLDAGDVISHWVQAGMKPVLVYTVQHAFYKDNIKKSNCDHKENLKS